MKSSPEPFSRNNQPCAVHENGTSNQKLSEQHLSQPFSLIKSYSLRIGAVLSNREINLSPILSHSSAPEYDMGGQLNRRMKLLARGFYCYNLHYCWNERTDMIELSKRGWNDGYMHDTRSYVLFRLWMTHHWMIHRYFSNLLWLQQMNIVSPASYFYQESPAWSPSLWAEVLEKTWI